MKTLRTSFWNSTFIAAVIALAYAFNYQHLLMPLHLHILKEKPVLP